MNKEAFSTGEFVDSGWERCNSEVIRKQNLIPFLEEGRWIWAYTASQLASFPFFRATSSNQRLLLLVQLRLFIKAHTLVWSLVYSHLSSANLTYDLRPKLWKLPGLCALWFFFFLSYSQHRERHDKRALSLTKGYDP